VPEIENMLRPRTLDHWMGLREYSMTERSERGRAPWGSPTRIFDLMLGDEHALRVVYDDMSQAFIELVYEPEPRKYSMTIDEWHGGPPSGSLFVWDGATRPAYAWPVPGVHRARAD
jgi:hypothetical protein